MTHPSPRSSPNNAPSRHPGERLRELFRTLGSLGPEDLERFLEDLLTPSELRAMADRWEVARLLDQGLHYRAIAKETGVSTATITRVARFYSNGQGYRAALKRSEAKLNQGERE